MTKLKYKMDKKPVGNELKGCVSLGKSENGFVIPDHMDSSTPKKRKIRKRIILS